MLKVMKLNLTKVPKSTGGVKYETDVPGETRPFSVYVPQALLEKKGDKFPPVIEISIEAVE